MSLQSALIGFLVGKTFTHPSFTPQENVVIQTTAVATGTLPLAAGFVGIIPALGLLNRESDGADAFKLTWLQGVEWSLAVAFFGCVPDRVASRLDASTPAVYFSQCLSASKSCVFTICTKRGLNVP